MYCKRPTQVATIVGAMLITCVMMPAAHADGAGETVVIFPLQGELSGAQAKLPERLTRIIKKQAKKRGMKANVTDASLDDTAMISGCESTDSSACRKLLLEQLGADAGIEGWVEDRGPGRFVVEVSYFHDTGKPVRKQFTLTADDAEQQFEGSLPALFGDPVAVEYGDRVSSGGNRFDITRVETSSWAVLGSGGGAMAAGVIFWLVASSKQGDIDNAPTNTPEDFARLVDLENNAKTSATLGNVFFLSGLALAGVGTYMAYRQGRSRKPAEPPAEGTAETQARVIWAPVAMPDGAGLTLHLTW